MSGDVLRACVERLLGGERLPRDMARAAMDEVMDGHASQARIAALLVALRSRPYDADEIAGMVDSMREHAVRVDIDGDAVDTCGTGGDGCGTFNISTVAAFVVAGAGCRVAKHGNRSASSRCGSADVLEALGVRIALNPDGVRRCVDEVGIGFLFAPAYHPAMRHAAPVRADLGIATVFNVLGPLANPARVRHQAVGVADPALVPVVAGALQRLGHRHALVFHGPDGMDELGPNGAAHGLEVTEQGITDLRIDPAELGVAAAPLTALRGGDARENARIARLVLAGERGAARDAVLLNAAAALRAADVASGMREGVELAAHALDSGAAQQRLDGLVSVSQECAA